MRAYHFVNETLKDGRPIPKDKIWLIHEGPLKMCESGLHASIRPIDALRYAPGTTLCRVEIERKLIKDTDKLVAEKRKILWRIDAEELLKAFARWCAIQVIDKWDASDVVIQFLRTGDESLRKAAYASATATTRAACAASASASAAVAYDYAACAAAAYASAASAAAAANAFSAFSAAYDAAASAAYAAQNVVLKEFLKEARAGYTEWELTW